MVIQQPQRGDSRQGGLKMYFHSYWDERLGLLPWKNRLTPTQRQCRKESWQSSHMTASPGFVFGFILSFLFSPPLFMFLLWWHNLTCPSTVAQQLTLLRFSAKNTLSVVPSGLGLVHAEHSSLPLRDGMIGFPCPESTCCLQWAGGISVCLAVCFQEWFIFNLTHRNCLLIISSYFVCLLSILVRNVQHWFGVS